MSKVSVIIPVYNAEPFLKTALDSILAQTFTDWEMLLVDDASTDRSLQICEQYANADPRVRVLRGEHAGPGMARQKGLDAATGEYIYFPDADDWAEPELLGGAVAQAEISGADVVLFGYWLEYPEKGKTPEKRVCALEGVYTKAQLLNEHLLAYYTTRPVTLWTRLFRRSYLDKTRCRFTAFPRGEDQMFIYDSELAEDYTVAILGEPYYHYIRRAGTTVERYLSDDEASIGLKVVAAYERVLLQSGDRENAKSLIRKNYAEAFLHRFINVTSPVSPLSKREQKAVIRALLRQPVIADSLRTVRLSYVDAGRYGKMTIWLMGRGCVNAAFALRRLW